MARNKTDGINEVMTRDIITFNQEQSCHDAAIAMRDRHIGNIIVTDSQANVCGLVTDRDLVLRVMAENRDPRDTPIGQICTDEVVSVGPDATIEDTIRTMSDNAIRRVPVIEGGHAVGIISLGDLAEARDPDSVLGRVSRAPANN